MTQATPPKTDEDDAGLRKPEGQLRRGWTTGACATAATKAALTALLESEFPDPVEIALPKGETPAFALAHEQMGEGYAEAGIIKDAGDDPDVTHGAMVIARVKPNPPGKGITFHAGEGVGIITKAGLPLPPGEPAINPVPRSMMTEVVRAVATAYETAPDFAITISVPGGAAIAEKTWNPRLGIKGGISILGTTGIVHPFSCAAWIHSIHRGIDVARAAGLDHILGATGSTSEDAARAIYEFPEIALLDMGDFAGGLLKYLRAHPVPKLTIAGGFAKITKLAQGHLDLHSARSQVDMAFLANISVAEGLNQDMRDAIQSANTAAEALEIADRNTIDLPVSIARKALESSLEVVRGAPIKIEIVIVDRQGGIRAQTGFHD
ncbi:MAG: cobalt-precorrin-5B (C(1))-methyltransferase [Pseudomonadota bacterium]